MTKVTDFKIQGLNQLERSLRMLPDRLRESALKNASAAGARVIRDEAKTRVAVNSGQLKDSIVVARSVKSSGRTKRLRGAVFVGIKGPARYYAHLVEFGRGPNKNGRGAYGPRPFMRSALTSKAPAAFKAIGDKLGAEIHRAAKKLTGWKSLRDVRRLSR